MSVALMPSPIDFTLPPELEAGEPPEARGLARDQVRLMVSYRDDLRVEHATFRELGRFLRPGDLLAINTSATLNAALEAVREDGQKLELHLSTRLPDERWSVELRLPGPDGTRPFPGTRAGERFALPGGGSAALDEPYVPGATRLWRARLALPLPLETYLARHGFPIRYGYVRDPWPAPYYQTVFAREPGSAEMPSAGRAFTPELVTELVSRGVQFAPLVLHTGVASLEDHEPPYAEYFRVPDETARAVNHARAAGRRVIAVGTTVVRALESVTDEDGWAHPGEGWTELIVTARRGVRAVDGLLTGLHEPRATHLAMLEALADRNHLSIAYRASLQERYLWHEFGDLHLILPRPI